MLSQVLLNVVGLVDIAMVGRLGAERVAAVGYATQFFHLSQSVLFAVGFACVALMANAIGAGRPARAREALAAALTVACGTSLVLTGVMLGASGCCSSWSWWCARRASRRSVCAHATSGLRAR